MAALGARRFETQAHEDKHERFIADVSFSGNFVDGWVEVKWCNKVPKTLDSIDHWTKGQENWLFNRGCKGSGHCYLLVGTPTMHVLWKFGMLAQARSIPWKQAAQLAVLRVPTLQELVLGFDYVARTRG